MSKLDPKIVNRNVILRLCRLVITLGVIALLVWRLMFYTPGKSYAGTTQPGDISLGDELKQHVTALATDIGERGTYRPESYRRALDYIVGQCTQLGYTPRLQVFPAGGMDCTNIDVEIPGSRTPKDILIVGAHYDTVRDTGGANDNTSGTAGVLVLARMLKDAKPGCTIRLAAFANEEPPHFQTPTMGSMVYARACKERGDKIIGMFTLETIGYYSDEPNSQRYPSPFDKVYPTTGNFIAFVANVESRLLMQDAIGSFRKHCQFPSEGGAVPDMAPGIGWSDHWSFWQYGYPAVMITDTATFRYPYYHNRKDTADKLDYARMAKVIAGVRAVILDLAK